MSETVNGAPNFGASSVKLPAAAFRFETLDFDPSGNPYYKFPPFLSTPDGTPLVPFHEFEGKGIVICFDSDVEEVDGEGIPTVQLGTKHGAAGDLEKRRRRKRSKVDVDSRKGPWWEEWREGEDLRRADCFDPNTPRGDRFSQGAYDFQQNRRWTPILQSLYDHFRHFCGLLSHPTKNSRFGKSKGADVNDDDDDDEEELTVEQERQVEEANQVEQANPLPKAFEEPKIHEIDAEYEAELEAKEMTMDAFLNDPEGSMKIFFSSYYKDKGLFWSEHKLRDGPILLSFFFSFFIRNKIMPDYEKAFRKAHKLTELARLELPQTTKISVAIPDTFGGGCVALWGSKLPITWLNKDVDGGSWLDSASASVKEWQEVLRENDVQEIGESIDVGVQETSSNWGAAIGGAQKGPPLMGGWGDSATVIDDGVDFWEAPGSNTDWTIQDKKPGLIDILGPTRIPLTHTVQLVEKSTRQIMDIAPPDPNDKGLGGVLGTVFLAPWKNPKEGGSSILPPELLSGLPEGSTFDMARDVIKVFADPNTVAVMREGMGLHGVFVQVVESAGNSGVVKVKKSKSRNKGKSKTKGSGDKEWWYIEFLYEVVPSFWIEEGD